MSGILESLWADGTPTVGLWHRIGTTQAAEIVGQAGFDWVLVDAQHGLIGDTEVRAMLLGLERAGCPSVVRLPWTDPGPAMRTLDLGAHGVLFPTVDNAEQVRAAVGACKFAPLGYRSWAGLGLEGERPAAANEATFCGVMIETADALSNLDSILAVEGLGFVFVGPDDLAIALGAEPTTEPTDPIVVDAIEHIGATCRARGMPAGIYCGSDAMVARWARLGFTVLACTSDLALLRESSAATALSARRTAEQAAREVPPPPAR